MFSKSSSPNRSQAMPFASLPSSEMTTMTTLNSTYGILRKPTFHQPQSLIGTSTFGYPPSWYHYSVLHLTTLSRSWNCHIMYQKWAITRLLLITRITRKNSEWQRPHTTPVSAKGLTNWGLPLLCASQKLFSIPLKPPKQLILARQQRHIKQAIAMANQQLIIC